MSKIYDALNELESNPLDLNNPARTDRKIPSAATGLTQELVEFEKLFINRVARLRFAADEAEAAVAIESQQATRATDILKSQIIALDSRLKETKELLESKDLAIQRLEREMSAKVNDLKNEAREKDETLASRVSEIKALQSEVNRLRDGIRGMVSMFNQQAQALGGHAEENNRMAALVEPAMPEAHISTSPQIADDPSGTFVASGTGLSKDIDSSTLER